MEGIVIKGVYYGDVVPGNLAMYKKRQLYNSTQNMMNISAVWDHWLSGQKLTPPTILIFDQAYMDLICRGGIPSKELHPVDGKHRLTVAYYFRAVTIPVIVLKRQAELIQGILKMA